MVAMPCFHIAGAGWGIICLIDGAHSVLLREVDPAVILRDIPKYGITHAVYVPAVLQLLVGRARTSTDTDFSSLDTILYGASPISEDILVKSIEVFGCRFLQAYGLTETDGAVVLLPPEDHDVGGPNAHRLRAAGLPMPGVELRVVDSDGKDCAVGDGRRGVDPVAQQHGGLLEHARRPPPRRSRPTAGSSRETRATSTPTATSTSTTASRT